MAPERISKSRIKEPVKKSVDIWSLGIILYELFTGDTPYSGDTTDDFVNDIYWRKPFNANIPQQVMSLIQKMLQIRAENRPTLEEIKSSTFFPKEFEP